jgi:hypothetical protein
VIILRKDGDSVFNPDRHDEMKGICPALFAKACRVLTSTYEAGIDDGNHTWRYRKFHTAGAMSTRDGPSKSCWNFTPFLVRLDPKNL